MALADIIRDRRKALGYTLLDIANKVNVSEATVQRWESGNIKNLRQERIAKLAEVLEVSPAELMGWAQKEPITTTDNELNQSEQQLLTLFRQLPEEDRDTVAGIVEGILKRKGLLK